MLKLNNINLDKNPELIQPPKVDDNIVVIALVPNTQEIIKEDILDVALSYSIAGIDVILEMSFVDRDKFNNKHLASLICNGGWSLSLLAPEPKPAPIPITKYNKKQHQIPTVKYAQQYNKKYNTQLRLKYCQQIIHWYQLWRSPTMVNFEKAIYPITPYLEYLSTHYLIDKNKKDLNSTDTQALIALSQNPSNPYLLKLMETMQTDVACEFKQQLEQFIKHNDSDFYQDIDLLTNQVVKTKC